MDCRGPDIPKVIAFQTKDLEELSTLEDNSALSDQLSNYSLPNVRLLKVPMKSGYMANVKLILPPEITYKSFNSYPLIVQV